MKDLRTDHRAFLAAVEWMHADMEREYLDRRDEERREREDEGDASVEARSARAGEDA